MLNMEVTQLKFTCLEKNNRNTKKKCQICPKLTIKTPERRLISGNSLHLKRYLQTLTLRLTYLNLNYKLIAGG